MTSKNRVSWLFDLPEMYLLCWKQMSRWDNRTLSQASFWSQCSAWLHRPQGREADPAGGWPKILCLFPSSSMRYWHLCWQVLFSFFPIIFISWRLIILQYCSGFCHSLTWISHGFTCVPHPEPLINYLVLLTSLFLLASLVHLNKINRTVIHVPVFPHLPQRKTIVSFSSRK